MKNISPNMFKPKSQNCKKTVGFAFFWRSQATQKTFVKQPKRHRKRHDDSADGLGRTQHDSETRLRQTLAQVAKKWARLVARGTKTQNQRDAPLPPLPARVPQEG